MTRDPRRLLFAVNNVHFLRSHRHALVLAARQDGWEVQVVAGPEENARDAAAATEYRALGVPVHRVHLTRAGLAPWDMGRTWLDLVQCYRRVQPVLVHHVTPKMVTVGSMAARAAGVPAVVNAISGLGTVFADGAKVTRRAKLARALYRASLRHRVQAVIVQNERDESVLRGLNLPDGTRYLRLPGSGVDLSRFRPEPPPPGPPLVVLPARILREKGVAEFAAAAPIVASAGVSARFALCGPLDPGNPSGIEAAELEALCRTTGVEWLGHRADMPAVFASATIVCLPSYYGEGLPLALAEAAASGRAIVTTDSPGCRDTVIPGVSGLLVPPRDAQAVAAAVVDILRTPGRAAAMGEAGRRFAEHAFAVEHIVAEHLALYRELSGPLAPLSAVGTT